MKVSRNATASCRGRRAANGMEAKDSFLRPANRLRFPMWTGNRVRTGRGVLSRYGPGVPKMVNVARTTIV